MDKHGAAFRAIAVLTQLFIEAGEPLFEVDYSDLNPTAALAAPPLDVPRNEN